MTSRRGTTNRNDRGSVEDRRRRRAWLVNTYPADRPLFRVEYGNGHIEVETYVLSAEQLLEFEQIVKVDVLPTCRCYRCGCLLTIDTVTVDRIIPGCRGGTYRRNNIRPACSRCNSKTGGATRRAA